jgi:hypothetical protein
MTMTSDAPRAFTGTGFRSRLEAAQRVVMTAHRCTADQAFDELLDVASRHHLDFAHFVEEFTAVVDRGTALAPADDLYSARAIAIEHWRLLTWSTARRHHGRTAS